MKKKLVYLFFIVIISASCSLKQSEVIKLFKEYGIIVNQINSSLSNAIKEKKITLSFKKNYETLKLKKSKLEETIKKILNKQRFNSSEKREVLEIRKKIKQQLLENVNLMSKVMSINGAYEYFENYLLRQRNAR